MNCKLCTDYDVTFENIMGFTCNHINNNKIETLVLGMSGGIDSTVCAALAREVADRCIANVKLKGLVLPIRSKSVEMERAIAASEAFCDSFEVKDMTESYYSLMRDIISPDAGSASIPDTGSVSIRRGNIKARMRMIKLYDTARKTNGLVLSTDNYTEYLLGFWTLHGDVGDYAMIQNLWKTEVYELAGYLLNKYKKSDDLYKAIALLEGIKAMPTDGLGISESDFDQIYPNYDKNSTPVELYGIVDAILLGYLTGNSGDDDHKVIQRHKATKFKRLNPFSIPREDLMQKIRWGRKELP